MSTPTGRPDAHNSLLGPKSLDVAIDFVDMTEIACRMRAAFFGGT